eukprot:TRINITY_DN1253_c0_g1_i4.p1 TRINITY_DN1253_c0_g1~~TRINITY_DN1253_c0_g1_i4.p1  ORF type:complete len:723 (+),score=244.54 TRINITY_DN1253_c0_g1_i4:32-2200(+)
MTTPSSTPSLIKEEVSSSLASSSSIPISVEPKQDDTTSRKRKHEGDDDNDVVKKEMKKETSDSTTVLPPPTSTASTTSTESTSTASIKDEATPMNTDDVPVRREDTPNLDLTIYHLPAYMDHKGLTKLLREHNIPHKKCKKIARQDMGWVFFESIEQRDAGKEKLQSITLKGNTLRCEPKLRKDPNGNNNNNNNNRNKNNKNNKNRDNNNNNNAEGDVKPESTIPAPPVNINDVVAEYWQKPYPEQLKIKGEKVQQVINNIARKIRDDSKHKAPLWAKDAPFIPFEGVKICAATSKYRSKLQFTIGLDVHGKICVGFMLGRIGKGNKCVGAPHGAVMISDVSMNIRDSVQSFLETSAFPHYSYSTHSGFWRLLTLKAFPKSGEIMVIMQINEKGRTKEEVDAEMNRFSTYMQSAPTKIKSLMYQNHEGVANDFPADIPCHLLFGTPYVHEFLLGQKFRVSPHAFFQVNTLGAEVLYSTVRDWSDCANYDTLLDICCGTGTIGQCMASSVKNVVGIELSQEAINDAIINAEENKHTNIKYVCGKVESVLHRILSSLPPGRVIGVVDPPRPGLNKDVLLGIRACAQIERLIYVSCEPTSLITDCSTLCRAESKSAKGAPFVPIKSIAVDMFPHTSKIEMITLFERQVSPLPSTKSVASSTPSSSSSSSSSSSPPSSSSSPTSSSTTSSSSTTPISTLSDKKEEETATPSAADSTSPIKTEAEDK